MMFSTNTPHNSFNRALEHRFVEVNLRFDFGHRLSQAFLLFALGCLHGSFHYPLRFNLRILLGLCQHFLCLPARLGQYVLRFGLGGLNEAVCFTLRFEDFLNHISHDNPFAWHTAHARLWSGHDRAEPDSARMPEGQRFGGCTPSLSRIARSTISAAPSTVISPVFTRRS